MLKASSTADQSQRYYTSPAASSPAFSSAHQPHYLQSSPYESPPLQSHAPLSPVDSMLYPMENTPSDLCNMSSVQSPSTFMQQNSMIYPSTANQFAIHESADHGPMDYSQKETETPQPSRRGGQPKTEQERDRDFMRRHKIEEERFKRIRNPSENLTREDQDIRNAYFKLISTVKARARKNLSGREYVKSLERSMDELNSQIAERDVTIMAKDATIWEKELEIQNLRELLSAQGILFQTPTVDYTHSNPNYLPT
jgi:hypothetical protein